MPLTIEPLIVGPLASCAYLVYSNPLKGALLIDAGDDPERILRALEGTGKTLCAILLTHGHFDHILAAPKVREATGARIYIAKRDAPMLQDPSRNLYQPGLAHTRYMPFQADETLEEGAAQIGGYELTVIPTPGHTPGGVSLYFPGEDVLFTGDTLFDGGYGRTDFPSGDANQLRASIQSLIALPPKTRFYPGHGDFSTIDRARRDAL